MSSAIPAFSLLELGAGKGLLARDILSHGKFRYQILERSPALRARQQEVLKDYEIEWLDDLPSNFEGCIFSNEFFDALPVHRFVQRGSQLFEIYVGDDFKELEIPVEAPSDLPSLKDGQIVDLNLEAREWTARIARSLTTGFHLAIDYGYLRQQFYAQMRGTLMCYRRHQASEDPYVNIGEQDMTAHVNFSDLIDIGAANGLRVVRFSDQKDFLIDAGILNEMQSLAVAGDAVSMQRLMKMKGLILPDRMGERFKVLLQNKS
jgi:SAM-dependent MidA family methyltransferase